MLIWTWVAFNIYTLFVNQIIAVTVEEEEDIGKFKDYKAPSSAESAAPAELKPQSEPTEPKKEKEQPKATKTEESFLSEDRTFSSPIARKLAEDNNVSF